MIPVNHILGITSPYEISSVKLPKNKESIAVFLFYNHQELEKIVGTSCSAAYVSFSKPKGHTIGGIFLSKEHLNNSNIFHECSHATYDYMQTVNPLFSLGKEYRKLSKKNKNEERFCVVLAAITNAVFKMYGNKTVV